MGELENVVAQMSLYVSKENLSSYCKVDDEFHDLILNICGNKWIIQIRDNLSSFIYRSRIKSLSVPGRLKHSLKEHQKIMESLKKHDSAEADRLSQIHMENTVINILKNVAKEKDRIKLSRFVNSLTIIYYNLILEDELNRNNYN